MEEDVLKVMVNHIQHLENKLDELVSENTALKAQIRFYKSLKKGSKQVDKVKEELPIHAYWY